MSALIKQEKHVSYAETQGVDAIAVDITDDAVETVAFAAATHVHANPVKQEAPHLVSSPLMNPAVNNVQTPAVGSQAIPDDSFTKFFTILLRSSVEEYLQAATCDETSMTLWTTLCERAKLPVPTERIRPKYSTEHVQEHFQIRAALVLEEAREAISRGLVCIVQKRQEQEILTRQRQLVSSQTDTQQGLPHIVTLDVLVRECKVRVHGITFLTLTIARYDDDDDDSKKYFTDEQKNHLMPGQVMECNISGSFALGCVLPCKQERIHKLSEFDMLLFTPIPNVTARTWTLTPVNSFIGPCRQFGACNRKPESIAFLQSLLGHQQRPSVTMTTTSSPDMAKNPTQTESPFAAINESDKSEPRFRIPTLNEKQEEAVSSFLTSPAKSISIIQGPPGTGKTSLIVATICRYLTPKAGPRQCLVVCAPTNKAVSVLANRFLSAASDALGCTVNMVLVGDDDKLMESKINNPLRPYYIFSWHSQVKKELQVIMKFFDPDRRDGSTLSLNEVMMKAKRLQRRVLRTLMQVPDCVKRKIDDLCTALQQRRQGLLSLFRLATIAFDAVEKIKSDAVEHDIMMSADIIFCTLCSSGSRVMALAPRQSIEAIIVDEAAAATEPDLYIPFHLDPSRLLIVGDPKQLPSTVLSERAKCLGLDVSLQERLMTSCGYDYTMLNVQYRMHPEISEFPSRYFYNSEIQDGIAVPIQIGRGQLLDGRPYSLIEVDGVEAKGSAQSTCNALEANIVVELVQQLTDINGKSWCCSVERLRVITFYTAQVVLLKRKLSDVGLQDVIVATVDSSQGCEADVVIVSFVRTNTPGFLTDDRRMNVALTRARHQLVCVGNVSRYPEMDTAHTLQSLVVDAWTRNAVMDVPTTDYPRKRAKVLFDPRFGASIDG